MKTCQWLWRLLPGLLLLPCMFVRAELNIARPVAVHHFIIDPGAIFSANGLDPVRENEGPIRSNVPLNELSVRAYRYFRKEWPTIEGESWFKTNKEYIVTFRNNSHRAKAFFNLKGAFLYSIEYYAGKDLAVNLAEMVQKRYPDFSIYCVTEISRDFKSAYYINIQNSSFIKTLSVINGKMDVTEELINANAAGSSDGK